MSRTAAPRGRSAPSRPSGDLESTKGVTLTLLRTSIVAGSLATVAIMATAAVAGAAAQPKIVPFTANFKGNAVVTVTDQVATISTTGAGLGTTVLMGAGKITGKGTGDASQQPCVPFTGTGSMTGVKGKLTFKVVPGSQGCGDEGGKFFAVTGRATVTGGAGKLAKAKGTLKLTGSYDRDAGTFAVKFAGKLTLPK